LGAWAARAPWLANLRDTCRALGIFERWTGLSRNVRCRAGDADTFSRKRNFAISRPSTASDVVLFVDHLHRNFEPENGRAAVAVLQRQGTKSRIAKASCGRCAIHDALCAAGRTSSRPEQIEEAKREARRLVDALAPGSAWRGDRRLEPGACCRCANESSSWASRTGGDAGRPRVLVEEFLAREQASRLNLPLSRSPKRVRSCMAIATKAFDAFSPTLPRSASAGGLCCRAINRALRMAGQLGYEAAHYESRSGWRAVAAARGARGLGDTLIVADGTSCRHQIADGTQHRARARRACGAVLERRFGHRMYGGPSTP